MIGFYILIAIGFCVFAIINYFLYVFSLLQASFFLTVILEIMVLWVCFGPQLILYYILTLKNNLESYSFLYEQYELSQKTINELEKQNIKDKKPYKDSIMDNSNYNKKTIESLKYEITRLEDEKEQILTEYERIKKVAGRSKELAEINKELKEENLKLQKIINVLKKQ